MRLVAVLLATTLIVVASSAVLTPKANAAPVELAYDSGVFTGSNTYRPFQGVRFSLPAGVATARILAVRHSTGLAGRPGTIHVTGPDHVTELTTPIPITAGGFGAFKNEDVSGRNVVVSSDFYVILENENVEIGGSILTGRCFFGNTLATLTTDYEQDYLIRVIIDPITGGALPSPVGGVIIPTNAYAIFAPYLAVIGLVAITAVAIKKRRN